MPTLVLDPSPPQLEQLLAERERLGLDRRDEVWEGVLHMIPPPSVSHEMLAMRLGYLLTPYADAAGLTLTGPIAIGQDRHDYRAPDLALLRPGFDQQWNRTAALVIEILSPDDETTNKVAFYAAHAVEELLIVDPAARTVDWRALSQGAYTSVDRSGVIELSAEQLAERIDWPA
ncbi:MAG: Uma2 family endonuclease [Solirubrobacteraceae bacterium]